jgi:ornithine cyclodeaminase
MVDYIGCARVKELVSKRGVAQFIQELADEIQADYCRWSDFDKSPRHAIHSSDGVIELMPTSDGHRYSFKYVNGHPKNTTGGLLTVTAFGVLADVATGYPLLLSEMTFVTALRTAAMSVAAAQRMARANSRVMALIGNGAQSEFQIIAFHSLLGIRELRLYDTDPEATAKLLRNLANLQLTDLQVIPCASTADAVRGADVVTTATADKCNALILTPDMIRPGMHLNAVGGDCPGKTELHADILHRADIRIVVEFEPQARIEGEIQQLDPSVAVIEFADVAGGKQCGRAAHGEVTLFDSVGFALNDFSSLRYLYRLNRAQHNAAKIDLVPSLDNPKDLFGALVGKTSLPRKRTELHATRERSHA